MLINLNNISSVKIIEFSPNQKLECWQSAQDLISRDLNWRLFKTVNTETY